ncbi:MAG: glycosyltransferase family 4 protein [Lachnospiraceae bacterium]|nr:glycosyltransferase family 4 protein [Lachnospiraceae bacterium]
MNVLILAKDGHVGGLTNHIKSLASGLVEYGDRVIVGLTPGDSTSFFFEGIHLEAFNFNSLNPLVFIKNYKKMKKVIESESIEIIQSENRITSFYAWLYCKKHKNVKLIWANHKVPISSSFFARLLTKSGEYAVASTIEGQQFLVDKLRINKNKTKVIHLGIKLEQFVKCNENSALELKQQNGFNCDDIVIMLYGRLTPDKGHMFFLDALKQVKCDNRVKIVFPGKNDEFKNELIKYAESLGINNIIFPGLIKGNEWLNFVNLVVLPSKAEGFPLACLEAFAMGVPTIRTKTGGYEDTKELCFGIDYGDIEEFANLLNAYLYDRTDMFIEKAVYAKAACVEYSHANMISEYRSMYKEVLKQL